MSRSRSIRSILLLDGDARFLRRLRGILEEKFTVHAFRDLRPALELLEGTTAVDLIIAAAGGAAGSEGIAAGAALPGAFGVRSPRPPVILLADPGSLRLAIEGVRGGAWTCLLKPFSPVELFDIVDDLEKQPLSGAPAGRVPPAAASDPGSGWCGIIGAHPSMRELFRDIRRAGGAGSRASILIQGESGTGKELVARAIHLLGRPPGSPAAGAPFIGINCGAFSRQLLEDQLFGHVRGAFTGALDPKEGVFAAAGEGTLFLDEVAEMDLDLQVRLLRAIQEREVVPLGSNTPIPWNARLIVATNRDLEAEVEEKRFRKDLYYRINIIRLRVPPLRERLEDLPLLCDFFLEAIRAGDPGRPRTLASAALERLRRYDFPGNVRELRNLLERACALGEGDAIQPDDLQIEERRAESGSRAGGGNTRGGSAPDGLPQPRTAFRPLADLERGHVLDALRLARGRKVLAAQHLNVDRNRLYRLIHKHRIRAEEIHPG